MRLKKFFAGIVIALLLITVLSGTVVSAASESSDPSFSVIIERASDNVVDDGGINASQEFGGDVKVKLSDPSVSGQDVKVDLTISGKNIVCFEGTLVYDKEDFTIVDIKSSDLLSESGGMVNFNQDETTNEFKSGRFTYASAIGKDMDGTVLEFTFKANDDAGAPNFSLEDLFVYEDSENGPIMCKINLSTPAPSVAADDNNTNEDVSGGGFNVLLLVIILVVVAVVAVGVIFLLKNREFLQKILDKFKKKSLD